MRHHFVSTGALVLVVACGKTDAPVPAAGAAASAAISKAALLTPDSAALAAAAPDSFGVHFTTSRGDFDVRVHRDWAPHGADRFYYLVRSGYYDGVRFFRVIEGFMAQFGVHGDPAVAKVWRDRNIGDDPVRHRNERGALTFAQTSAPNSRSTQLFINFGNNGQLDGMRFAPIGVVVTGMSVVDSLYHGYGEGAPQGGGPDQGRLGAEGNAYLRSQFPKLDSIATARITDQWKKP